MVHCSTLSASAWKESGKKLMKLTTMADIRVFGTSRLKEFYQACCEHLLPALPLACPVGSRLHAPSDTPSQAHQLYRAPGSSLLISICALRAYSVQCTVYSDTVHVHIQSSTSESWDVVVPLRRCWSTCGRRKGSPLETCWTHLAALVSVVA